MVRFIWYLVDAQYVMSMSWVEVWERLAASARGALLCRPGEA